MVEGFGFRASGLEFRVLVLEGPWQTVSTHPQTLNPNTMPETLNPDLM